MTPKDQAGLDCGIRLVLHKLFEDTVRVGSLCAWEERAYLDGGAVCDVRNTVVCFGFGVADETQLSSDFLDVLPKVFVPEVGRLARRLEFL